MKRTKKIFAMLLAFTMILGMTLTASAETTTATPSSNDKLKISATNIEEADVTVTAYQIVEANYTENGFTGYSWAVGCGFANTKEVFVNGVLNLSDTELAALTSKISDLSSFEMEKDTNTDTTYVSKEKLEAGTYMILVTGSASTIYNPMIASVYYKVDGTGIATDAVNATDKWSLETKNAYAKSDKPSVDKVIVKADDIEVKGDDGAYNENINFKVTGVIPSYSKQYTTVNYNIVDTLSTGLSFVSNEKDVIVKVESDEPTTEIVKAGDDTYSVTISGQIMTIAFASDYIKANGLKEVEVTYVAKINENAPLNYNGNTNTVYAEYSNNPTDETSKGKTPEVVTYHYTFGIDASLLGSTVTSELFKTDNGVIEAGATETTYTYLNGAEFTLTRTDAPDDYTGKTVYTTITGDGGETGDIQFKGLDAGTYTLVETKAPTGYQLDTTEHSVVITAEYNTDGTLKSYAIVIDGKPEGTSTYVNKATDNKVDELGDIKQTATSTLIKNTKLIALPSTGGIGTTIFTVAGCVIMIAAVVLFLANRRRDAR